MTCNIQNPLIVYPTSFFQNFGKKCYVFTTTYSIQYNKVLRNKREARVDVNLMRRKCLVLPLVVGINISCCKSKVVVMPLSLTPRTITKHKQYAYGVQLAGSWQRSSGVQCVARVDNYCALFGTTLVLIFAYTDVMKVTIDYGNIYFFLSTHTLTYLRVKTQRNCL